MEQIEIALEIRRVPAMQQVEAYGAEHCSGRYPPQGIARLGEILFMTRTYDFTAGNPGLA